MVCKSLSRREALVEKWLENDLCKSSAGRLANPFSRRGIASRCAVLAALSGARIPSPCFFIKRNLWALYAGKEYRQVYKSSGWPTSKP